MRRNKQILPSESVSPRSDITLTFKQAFQINKNPFPWIKAFGAGISAALPVIIGLLLGSFEKGLIAGIGGFTFLYMFNQPYALRAKKLFFVLVGISLSVALGTLVAPYPLGTAIMMGLIGAFVIFIFGALKVIGPSALFFVLSFAMATGMPVDPTLAPMRGGLVLLGGSLSWIIAMLPWFIDPHGPETKVVKKVYLELANLLDSFGTEHFNSARHRTVLALKQADDTLIAGYTTWRTTDRFRRLCLLTEHANALFMEVLDLSIKDKTQLSQELGKTVRALASSIESKEKNQTQIPQPEHLDEGLEHLFTQIYNVDAIMNEPVDKIQREVRILKRSLRPIFLGAFDKNSIVFLSSLRYGIIIMIAAVIAYSFDFNRSYWIPLSCASVMSGATIIATFHRTIQRSFGTIIGILLASLILTTVHAGYMVALIILILTFITELFIVRNYGLAAMFFTPSALIMAEYSTQMHDFSFFATVRITDILIGSLIGLIGTLVLGRHSASSLLNHFITKTIRSQGQFLLLLFSEGNNGIIYEENRERRKMQTNLVNLKTVYNTALGELFRDDTKLESLWPVIFSIEQIGYLLDASLKYDKRPELSDNDLAQLFYVFETLAMATEKNQQNIQKNVPYIKGFSKIQKEIISLQEAIQVSKNFSV